MLVNLELKNTFAEKVESARAVCFLTDEQGKVVDQRTEWASGGTRERSPLKPGATDNFNFLIAAERLTSTNLAPRVTFSRAILEGGKLADATKQAAVPPTK